MMIQQGAKGRHANEEFFATDFQHNPTFDTANAVENSLGNVITFLRDAKDLTDVNSAYALQ